MNPPSAKFLSAHVNTEPTWRGGEQQTLYLIEGLRRRGYPTVLFATAGTPLDERARAAGFTVEHLRIRSEADLPAILRLAGALRRVRPTVLHLHTSHAHAIGVAAAALARRGIRRIVSRRVDFSIYRHSFLGLNRLKYAYGVDLYLTVSNLIRDVLIRDGIAPERIRVVHSGVDAGRFHGLAAGARPACIRELGIPDGVPLVGGVGALVQHKGFEHLIEAAALVLRERDCAFVVAGEGELREALSRKIAGLGIEKRFHLLGFRSDIGEFLAALQLFAFPSVTEGLGTSLLDALLLELPVVASRTGGIPEVIEHGVNGLLVEPGNAGELARAILRLLADPDEVRRLGAEGRRKVLGSFSVEAMVEGTLAAYHEVIGGRPVEREKLGREEAGARG